MELYSVNAAGLMTGTSDEKVQATRNNEKKPILDVNVETFDGLPTAKQVQEALDIVNKAALIEQRSLSFSVDELSGRSIVTIKDKSTEQVIRQIPSEELIKVSRDIRRLQEEMGSSLGILINNKV